LNLAIFFLAEYLKLKVEFFLKFILQVLSDSDGSELSDIMGKS